MGCGKAFLVAEERLGGAALGYNVKWVRQGPRAACLDRRDVVLLAVRIVQNDRAHVVDV